MKEVSPKPVGVLNLGKNKFVLISPSMALVKGTMR